MLGRAGRLAALGAMALLALLLAAAEPRPVDGPARAVTAVDQYVAETGAVVGVATPRVRVVDGQPAGKRSTALVAAVAAGAGAAVLAVSVFGALPTRRRRRPRWARRAIRAPPALLAA